MTKKKNEPVLILQIRSYQEPTKFVTCYVIKRHEHADQSLLWGEVFPEEAERMAVLFGDDNVEREAQPSQASPLTSRGKKVQRELFGDNQ